MLTHLKMQYKKCLLNIKFFSMMDLTAHFMSILCGVCLKTEVYNIFGSLQPHGSLPTSVISDLLAR